MKSVVILGMHRSGTSAIAKALSIMGVNLGVNLLPPKEDNKKGFWEDFNIVDFNTNLMQKQSQDWYTFGPIEQDFSDECYEKVIKYVEKEFGDSIVWGFKDPRTSRLIPFWDSILKKINSDVVYCVVVRNPLSVIKSLEKRDGFSAHQAGLLWYQYNMDIIAELADVPFTVIDYDSLLIEPENNLIRLANGIGQSDSLSDTAIEEYCQEFLSGGLRNSKFTLDSLNSDDSTSDKIAQLYLDLLNLTNEPSVYLPPHLKENVRLWKETQSSNIDMFNLLNDVLKVSTSESARLSHCNSSLDIALSHVEYLLKERDHVINERDIMEKRHQMAVASLEESQNKERLLTVTKENLENELDRIYNSGFWKFFSPLRYIIKMLKR
ncbi:sulfotransferase family protein [Vibrio cyclitrophicus 1F53]|uniref:sulfotransferase family protein n=1 Tax=Vibrio TaxID=662 RepID=UPI0002D9C986|nr:MULTISPECIES: sulfotransferase family protein [Vibrio]MBE8606824.1 sulfotransferase family protein [Vibrio sp. OPT10]NOI36244.1 sulfotransferase family protein [Vibrio cyclitrophicus]OEE85556.1 hypothetical protein OAI_03965 [Vibrio cyclitrophicus FF160]OEF32141.1 hypothetical protein OA7_16535 [Vibrio cyclitrophicus 1F53]OEF64806.1 hypothetical protein OAA_10465 [Vibrio cyclitrophicus 1F175]